ncbi:hypothetical protein DFH07DRAFT_94118 [Mycena maculata]|uniref:Uncharacterized protein n=1 Tax=Mycena maculata TaxID=230809 RepID=A0AAD7MYI0_9AGAR|nr:hypothetical protein DFH07DRAFT_94118 [Mycena maculata]
MEREDRKLVRAGGRGTRRTRARLAHMRVGMRAGHEMVFIAMCLMTLAFPSRPRAPRRHDIQYDRVARAHHTEGRPSRFLVDPSSSFASIPIPPRHPRSLPTPQTLPPFPRPNASPARLPPTRRRPTVIFRAARTLHQLLLILKGQRECELEPLYIAGAPHRLSTAEADTEEEHEYAFLPGHPRSAIRVLRAACDQRARRGSLWKPSLVLPDPDA